MECNAINIKILLLLFAKRRSLNTLALPRIFTDCFEYPIPYLTQSTQKVLAKFSCPKKSQKQKFQTQKIHSISPITWIPEYLSLHLLLRYSIHWTLIRGRSRGGPPLYLDQTEARRAGKRFFWDRPPFILGSGLGSGWPPHPPPSLKVWIHYFSWSLLVEGVLDPSLVIRWCHHLNEAIQDWLEKQTKAKNNGTWARKSCEELGPRKYVLEGCHTAVGQGTMPLRVWNLICSQTFLFLFWGF